MYYPEVGKNRQNSSQNNSLSGSLVNSSLKLISEATQSVLHVDYLNLLCTKA